MNERRTTEVTIIDQNRTGVSWSAVLAGAVVAISVMVVLNLLAVGIGISSIDLTGDPDPLAGVAGGLGWSMIIINLLALAAGGYVSGRFASIRWHGNGWMQGLLTWALLMLIGLWMLGTAAGTIVGSVGNIVGGGLNLAAQGVGAMAPALTQGVDNATEDLDLTGTDIRAQVSDLLRATADEGTVTDPVNPVLADVRVNDLVQSIFTPGEDPFTGTNREDLVSLLEDETDLTDAEVQEVVDSWEQSWTAAQARVEEARTQLTQAAEDAQAAVTRAMLWGAVAMIVTALLAGWMATIGVSRRPHVIARSTRIS